ncbi:MAG: YadA-like family protein [Phycisphaerae bacterium]
MQNIPKTIKKLIALIVVISTILPKQAMGTGDTSARTIHGVEASADVDQTADPYISAADDFTIIVDADDGGTGEFIVIDNDGGDPAIIIRADAGTTTLGSSTVSITNDASVGGDLGVTGATSLGNTLGVTGLSTLSGGASISGGIDNNDGGITNAGAISGVTTLEASGLATLSGGIVADGIHISDATSGENNISGVDTLGATTINADTANIDTANITTANAIIVHAGDTGGTAGTINVTDGADNTIILDGDTGDVYVGGTLTADGGLIISGGIDNNDGGITNAGAISGVTTLEASDLATLSGGIVADGIHISDTVSGENNIIGVDNLTASTINTEIINAGDTSGAEGIINITDGTSNTIVLDGSTGSISGTSLSTSGDAQIGGTLDVTGAVTMESTLEVSGLASLNGGIIVDGGNFIVASNGDTSISGILEVSGDLTATGTNNTIGTAGSSTNIITGETNTIAGTTSSSITGGNAGVNLSTNNASIAVTGGAGVTATDTQVTVLTSDGKGLTVNETTHTATLTGGSNSSTLELADDYVIISVGTETTEEITVLNATNDGTATSIIIGGDDNISNQILANADGGTNLIEADTTNTLSAGTNNIITAAQQNQLTGGTGNTITATTGNNTITASAGSNIISANADNQSNTISAMGTNGTNNFIANAVTGTNNIEGAFNNIGSATANSTNTIGNAGTSTNIITGATNTIVGETTITSGGNSIEVSGDTDNNRIIVGNTQEGSVGVNTFDYGTYVGGGMLVDGDLGVNGSIYSLNPTASATVNVGNNGMTIIGADNTVILQADDDEFDTNARAQLIMTPTTANLFVNTDNGVPHGIMINQTSTVVSGGTNSTSLTLDDNGARFQNDTTGGPARVTGVADGVGDYDAVNMRQYRKLEDRVDRAYSGIASIAALSAIPDPIPGKNVSIGLGFGNFENTSALAVGTKAILGEKKNLTVTAGLGYSNKSTTISAGIGWSF